MPVPVHYVKYPHRIEAVCDIPLVNGVTIPTGRQGWLISYSHLWNEPNVLFDNYGYAGIEAEHIKAVRVNGHLVRTIPPIESDDGLLTCFRCRDRYTTNKDGICGYCKQQEWLDNNA